MNDRKPSRAFVTLTALAALFVAGCTGTIGSGDDAATSGGNDDDADTDPTAVESGELPIRRLTGAELRYVMRDLFPGTSFDDVDLGAPRKEGRFSTYAENQAVSSLSHKAMEDILATVADRVVPDAATFFGCDPEIDAACVEAFLRDFGPRVFRRAFDEQEVDRFAALYRALRAQGDARSAATGTLQALLLSPYFLYHFVEAPQGTPGADGRVRLRGEEIATRLSFLLWSSGPDEALADAVTTGTLDTDDGVRAQAERMMKDPKFARFAEAFLLEWLEVDRVAALTKDVTRIPEWNATIAADMAEEARRYAVAWGTSEAPSFATLLTSNERFLNARLAAFVGVDAGLDPATDGDAFAAAKIVDRARASGVFTLGGFLATHATMTGRFGPTYRAKWLRKRLLCGVVGSPDPALLALAPKEEAFTTTRAYHEQLTQAPVCGGCHVKMDGMAFSLESFDGAGRFRTEENGVAVDTSATIAMSTDDALDGTYANIADLSDALAASPVTHACFGQNLAEYAFGRLVVPSTDAVQVDVGASLAEGGLHAAMVTLVTSPAFVSSLVDPSKGEP